MKTKTSMLLSAVLALVLISLVAIFGSGCGGDDDTACAEANCPDAGLMTADADPTAPDADTAPDANSDPCAEYAPYAGQTWNCAGSFSPTDCTIQLGIQDGGCYVYCIEACPAPPEEAMAVGHFICTTYSNAQQECWH